MLNWQNVPTSPKSFITISLQVKCDDDDQQFLNTLFCLYRKSRSASAFQVRVQDEQFSEEKGFIQRDTENEVVFPPGFEPQIHGLRSELSMIPLHWAILTCWWIGIKSSVHVYSVSQNKGSPNKKKY